MTIKELQTIIEENFTDEKGVINIRGLEFNTDVDMSDLKIKGTLFQRYQQITEDLWQEEQEIGNSLIQNHQEIGFCLDQDCQTVEGYLYQNWQTVKGDVYQHEQEKIKNNW
jgi:hypothetical protein